MESVVNRIIHYRIFMMYGRMKRDRVFLLCGLAVQCFLEEPCRVELLRCLARQLTLMDHQAPNRISPWKMNKAQLMDKAEELDCLVHSTWTVGEIRQVVVEKIKELEGAQRSGLDDFAPAPGHLPGDGPGNAERTNEGAAATSHSGQRGQFREHDCSIRPPPGPTLQGGARLVPQVVHGREPSQQGQRFPGSHSVGELRGHEVPGQAHLRPRDQLEGPLHPVGDGLETHGVVCGELDAIQVQGLRLRAEGSPASTKAEGAAEAARTRGDRDGAHESGCAGRDQGGDRCTPESFGGSEGEARDVNEESGQSERECEAGTETVVVPQVKPDFYELSPGGSEQPGDEPFSDCLEASPEQVDDLPKVDVDSFAKRLLRERDFSHQSCEEIVKTVCQECQAGRKRKVHESTCSVAFGAYSHGNHYGVINKGYQYPNVVRYINKYMKTHGAKGQWSSVQLGWDCPVGPHKDVHNKITTTNWTISLGSFSGGRLWLESLTDAEAQPDALQHAESRLADGNMTSGLLLIRVSACSALTRNEDMELRNGMVIGLQSQRTRLEGLVSLVVLSVMFSGAMAFLLVVNKMKLPVPVQETHGSKSTRSVLRRALGRICGGVPRERVHCSPSDSLQLPHSCLKQCLEVMNQAMHRCSRLVGMTSHVKSP